MHPGLRNALLKTGEKALNSFEWVIGRYSKVGDAPFLPNERFPWVKTLEDSWEEIREELDVVLKRAEELPNFQDVSVDQKRITDDSLWKTFFFYGYGFMSEDNCKRCPKTAATLQRIPGLKTAFFSVLMPGKHIPAHKGPYKGVLRGHLGLIVPDPKEQCRIRVADEFQYWEEGKVMVFDDRFDHEVWNDTDGTRVVLFIDVERPLPAPVAFLNKGVMQAIAMSPYIQDAKKRHVEWENKFAAAQAEFDAKEAAAPAKKAPASKAKAEKSDAAEKSAKASDVKVKATPARKPAAPSSNGKTDTAKGTGIDSDS